MAGENIFLTGATGKIGKILMSELSGKGCDLTVLCRKRPGKSSDPDINYICGDLLDPDSYCSGLKGIDTVVHMAAVSYEKDPDKYYEINSNATLKLVEKCAEHKVKRFIYVSTWVTSEKGGHYSRSKLAAERHVKESGLDWVIVRLSEVYGVSEEAGLDLILKNINRSPFVLILGNGNNEIAPVYVRDVTSALERIIDDKNIRHKTYNVLGPETFTFNQFVDKVIELNKTKKIKVHVPVWLFKAIATVMCSFLKNSPFVPDQVQRLFSEKTWDISLASRELSYKPAKLEDIIGKNKMNYQVKERV